MKHHHRHRLLCLAMASILFPAACPAADFSTDAVSIYDATLTITPPHPNDIPQAPEIAGSSFSLEPLGYFWQDNFDDRIYLPASSFMEWYFSLADERYSNTLRKFQDGHSYRIAVIAKISSTAVPVNAEGDVTILDAETGESIGETSVSYMPVSMLISQLPSGASLPSDLSKDDALAVFEMASFSCAPEGHEHANGSYQFDNQNHWRICADCGVKLMDTIYSHSTSTDKNADWTVAKSPTDTQDGLWEKRCSNGCGYVYDTISVPCLQKQTVVSTYAELQAALEKGGKQWISLKKSQWITQEDMERDNKLLLNDPDAEITLDLNDGGISRETGRSDNALFEVTAGSLHIINRQNNSGSSSASIGNNLEFYSAASDGAMFRVGENGSLRLTNVHGLTPDDSFAYSMPIIISEGTLSIDGGKYCSYIPDFDSSAKNPAPAVLIRGGKSVFAGGDYYGAGCAVAVLGGTLTIQDGTYGALDKAVYAGRNSSLIIKNGTFRYENTAYGWQQDYGLYLDGSSVDIYGGNFYGKKAALCVPKSNNMLCIYDGYFKNTSSGTLQADEGALAFYASGSMLIRKGTFAGTKGIAFFNASGSATASLGNFLMSGSTASDDNTGAIDPAKDAESFGTEYLRIQNNQPWIIEQPASVEAVEGSTISFRIEAKDAVRYAWFICDADDEYEQPYLWEDLKNHCTITGEDSDTLVLTGITEWFDNKAISCGVYSKTGSVCSPNALLTVTPKGDVNSDGTFTLADLVMLQRWLLADGSLTNWNAADSNQDKQVNGFDLALLKAELLS